MKGFRESFRHKVSVKPYRDKIKQLMKSGGDTKLYRQSYFSYISVFLGVLYRQFLEDLELIERQYLHQKDHQCLSTLVKTCDVAIMIAAAKQYSPFESDRLHGDYCNGLREVSSLLKGLPDHGDEELAGYTTRFITCYERLGEQLTLKVSKGVKAPLLGKDTCVRDYGSIVRTA